MGPVIGEERLARLLREFRHGLLELYGVRLKGLFLYGSYARRQESPGSDIDVVVVLDDFASYGAEIDRTSELAARLSLQYGISISRVFIPEETWQSGRTVFLANVREEAVPV